MKINKAVKTLIVGAMCLSMTLGAAACTPENNPGGGDYTHIRTDMETRPVSVAIGNLDENFNPFFYTALNDGEIVSLTQISMLSVDRDGNPACGQDEPTVVQAYRTTVSGSGNDQQTLYEFVIKNGIKFSDGVDLTIKDVLFNLYVYLDPLYSGSSTIYATKIKGLNAYRSQNPTASDDDADNSDADYVSAANTRMSALMNADEATGSNSTDWTQVSAEMKKDIISVANEFKKELTSDWNSTRGTVSSYSDTYQFTQDWEVFLFNEGFIGYEYYNDTAVNSRRRMTTGGYNADGSIKGKYVTTIDKIPSIYSIGRTEGLQYEIRREIESELEGLTGTALEEKMRDIAIETVFNEYFYVETAVDGTINYAEPASTGSLNKVLNGFATGTNIRQQFLNEARSAHFDEIREKGDLPVKSVSGIEIGTTNAADFAHYEKGSPLNENETYDVLKITINGIDPVAIYNFGFGVAPMHYYSGKVGDIDYVERCNNNYKNPDVSDRFGVPYASTEFFDNVLKASSKTAKPVGAGVYMVQSGNDRILQNKDCLYERNPYFETVGSGLSNAKIKYFKYCSRTEDQLVNTLITGGVDFGMPNCTPENIRQLAGHDNIANGTYDAGGFGYVGINPKLVPEVGVRQAIMKAMNINEIVRTYYTEEYATTIYRPISLTSWVYQEASDEEVKQYFSEYVNSARGIDLRYTTKHEEIIQLVKDAGYTYVGSDGVRQNAKGDRLKYTFTIAGETTDHPAFAMFKRAETFLTECGFEITVQTDINALQKLATGSLAVWAAAWSAGVDPDMYQVYHSASKASSVKNWGYDVILQDPSTYSYEAEVLDQLDDKIMEGRSKLEHIERRYVYYEALDLVMDLVVELPTYQRRDLYVYNTSVIRGESLVQGPNANLGVLSRIWELDYV